MNHGGRFWLCKKAENPFRICYDSELDISQELEIDKVSYLQKSIIILRLMIKFGRIDIITKVSLLSSHVAFPREGHLDAAVHVMDSIYQRYNYRLVYDPSFPEKDPSVFRKHYCSEFYQDTKVPIPMKAPEP